MPILDANGNPIEDTKPEEAERTRTLMMHLPMNAIDGFSEEVGLNVQRLAQHFGQVNPIAALVISSQLAAVLFNSINWPTIEEKVEAEKLLRNVLDNAIKNGDDFESPTPALLGNALLSPRVN